MVSEEANDGLPTSYTEFPSVDVAIQSIVVGFDVWVDPSESVVSVTNQAGKAIPIDVQWEGMRAEVFFKEALEPQTTYTVEFLNLLDSGAFRTPKASFTFTTTND